VEGQQQIPVLAARCFSASSIPSFAPGAKYFAHIVGQFHKTECRAFKIETFRNVQSEVA
jgi:hypothetical protein